MFSQPRSSQEGSSQAGSSRDRGQVHVVLMLALTAATGIVDAAGFLGLNRVFTGNITGSVVVLGMGLTGAEDLPVLGPICALISFAVGAVVAGRVLRPIAGGWTSRTTLLFGLVGVVIAALSVLLALTGRAPSGPLSIAVICLLGSAMGIQTATARHLAVRDVNTVVVTTVVAGLAADSRLGARRHQPVARRVVGILAIGTGAVIGAAAWRWHLGLSLAFAAAIILTVSFLGHRMGRVEERSS